MVLLLLISIPQFGAAPENDQCSTPSLISISNNGFDLGTFTSSKINLREATVDQDEFFNSNIINAGNDKKSIWFTFEIPTARAVRIELKQDANVIGQGDAAFTTFFSETCHPGQQEAEAAKITPLEKFGSSFHPCLDVGTYLVQVSSKSQVEFLSQEPEVYFEITIGPSEVIKDYDLKSEAHEFGTLQNVSNNSQSVNYSIGCQSIGSEEEFQCLQVPDSSDFTQSTWHTFTTPAFIDVLQVSLGRQLNLYPVNYRYSIQLFEGDAKQGDVLTAVGGCNVQTMGRYAGEPEEFLCNLKGNTGYSIRILFHKDAVDDIILSIRSKGKGSTGGPIPTVDALSPSNQLGILPSTPDGTTTIINDMMGCNGNMVFGGADCGTVNPIDGVTVKNGYGNDVSFDQNTWFNLELQETASLRLVVSKAAGAPMHFRIFNKQITGNCADIAINDLFDEHFLQFPWRNYGGNNMFNVYCLPAGHYAIQILTQSGFQSGQNSMSFYLGEEIEVQITAKSDVGGAYNLSEAGKVFQINNGNSLVFDTQYNMSEDKFSCQDNVLPELPECLAAYNPAPTKAIYSTFKIDNSVGGGLLDFRLTSSTGFPINGRLPFVIFDQDVNAVAAANNMYDPADILPGIEQVGNCYTQYNRNYQVCVAPGDYTIAALASEVALGSAVGGEFELKTSNTKFGTLTEAENLGDITDLYPVSSTDYFSCVDNYTATRGIELCGNANKASFREFYISKPKKGYIYTNYMNTSSSQVGTGLYRGRATDISQTLVPISNPEIDNSACSENASLTITDCYPLQPGWYTLVSYDIGPSYEDPSGVHSIVSYEHTVHVLLEDMPERKYNRPDKAFDKGLINWGPNLGTDAHPITRNQFYFDPVTFVCAEDTPFADHPITGCSDEYTRTAYYVFSLDKLSDVRISGLQYNQHMIKVYDFDARTEPDRLLSDDPIQPCYTSENQINFFYSSSQLCNLGPGSYTIVVFGNEDAKNSTVNISVYVEKPGISNFDHASQAYDFGLIPGDGVTYNGKPGTVHPDFPDRAPSHDTFFCTTGAQQTDPMENNYYLPRMINTQNMYPYRDNIALYDTSMSDVHWFVRRNLWYTFVLEGQGATTITLEQKGDYRQSGFVGTVFESNVDPDIDFIDLVSTGKVDSTLEQGLTLVPGGLQFFKADCSGKVKKRYYLLVDNISYRYHYDNYPNKQVEVNISFTADPQAASLYDHFSHANVINGLDQPAPPYDDVPLLEGTFRGVTTTLSCATKAETDVNTCGEKTVWYKFKVAESKKLNYGLEVDGNWINGTGQGFFLFSSLIEGDSTTSGLQQIYGTQVNDGTRNWQEICIGPGTYYIMLTNCAGNEEKLHNPVVQLTNSDGDYCSAPMVISLGENEEAYNSTNIQCHTMGTDFGEDGSNLGCLNGPDGYKSTWFRVDLSASTKSDLSFRLTNNTDQRDTEIYYRAYYGDCSFMTPGPCNTNALTEFTLNCMQSGSYFIQVVSPQRTLGEIGLTARSIPTVDQDCNPTDPLQPVADFRYESRCDSDTVNLINSSTEGSVILYEWSYGGQVFSTERDPKILKSAFDQGDNGITLVVKNSINDKTADISKDIIFEATLPDQFFLEDSLYLCPESVVNLSTFVQDQNYEFLWSTGEASRSIDVMVPGTYWLEIKGATCLKKDTINVKQVTLPDAVIPEDIIVCGDSTVSITVDLPAYELRWSTGEVTSSISITDPGIYWLEYGLNGCFQRDSVVYSEDQEFSLDLGEDLTLCEGQSKEVLLSAENGLQYTWYDGSETLERVFDSPGTYWLTGKRGTCVLTDTLKLSYDSIKPINFDRNYTICEGEVLELQLIEDYDGTVWEDGNSEPFRILSETGTYWVQATSGVCTLTDTVDLDVRSLPALSLPENQVLCEGEIARFSVPDEGYDYVWSDGTTSNSIMASAPGLYWLEARNEECSVRDSVLVTSIVLPLSNLPKTIRACEDSVVELIAEVADAEFRWSSGSVQPAITLFDPGLYWLEVSKDKCMRRDTIEFFVDRLVLVDLGEDRELCEGEMLEYNLTFEPDAQYVWHDGLSNNQRTFDQSGDIWLSAQRGECVSFDGITLNVLPNPESGLDDRYSFCEEEDAMVEIKQSNVDIQWFDGSSDPGRIFQSTGSYWVRLSRGSCFTVDTVQINIDQLPGTQIPEELELCEGEQYELSFPDEGYTYIWSNGVTGNLINITAAGTYQVTSINNQCETSDEIVVTYNSNPEQPVLSRHGSVVLCEGNSAVIEMSSPVMPDATYQWKYILGHQLVNGPLSTEIEIDQEGRYYLEAYNQCDTVDSEVVDVTVSPIPETPVVRDVAYCEGEPVFVYGSVTQSDLMIEWFASPADDQFLYTHKSGSVEISASIGQTTLYAAAFNGNCRSERVPAEIAVHPNPVVDAGDDLGINTGESVQLNATGAFSYEWYPADYLNNLALQNPTTTPESTIVYEVKGTNEFGCSDTDEIEIVLLTEMIIPNAFSPNGDGVNDEWQIVNAEFYNVHITIYDRWGNIVYRNNDFDGFWNGQATDGRQLSTDTYFYKLEYSGAFQDADRATGHVNLLR